MTLGEEPRLRMLRINHPENLSFVNHRNSDFRHSVSVVSDIPRVPGSIGDQFRLTGLRYSTHDPLAQLNFYWFINFKLPGIFISESRFLNQNLPFLIDKIDYAIYKTKPTDAVLSNIPQDFIDRVFTKK